MRSVGRNFLYLHYTHTAALAFGEGAGSLGQKVQDSTVYNTWK